MKIVISGSVSNSYRVIEEIRNAIIDCFIAKELIKIVIPKKSVEDLKSAIIEYYDAIDDCDLLIAVKKADDSMGDGTAYEYAYAEYAGKMHLTFSPQKETVPELMNKIGNLF